MTPPPAAPVRHIRTNAGLSHLGAAAAFGYDLHRTIQACAYVFSEGGTVKGQSVRIDRWRRSNSEPFPDGLCLTSREGLAVPPQKTLNIHGVQYAGALPDSRVPSRIAGSRVAITTAQGKTTTPTPARPFTNRRPG